MSEVTAHMDNNTVALNESHDSTAWLTRYTETMLNTFGRPQRVLVRGDGVHVWDADGRKYLDLLAGIAVNSLGHAHPTLTAAISAQLGTLGHVSNFFATPTQITLAHALLERAGVLGQGRVFFTNSGTEANEAAFKLARRTGRSRILALTGGFHGRSMGALALTHKEAYRSPFEPLPAGVEFIEFNNIDALTQAFADNGDDVAALICEPIQGEAGVKPLQASFLHLARELTTRHGALFILDEVQTGMGRTGYWFAHQNPELGAGITPDAMTLAKGLGSGFPIGALITFTEQASQLLGPGQHGTTFGGNPVAAAAGLATIGVIERDGLLVQVRNTGDALRERVRALNHPLISDVRGHGQLTAIEWTAPISARITERALEHGIILNAVNPTATRLSPPLIITLDDLVPFFDFLAGLPAHFDKE